MRALLAVLALVLAMPAAAARPDRIVIPVSATVMARMKLKLHDHPPALTVGREDVRRGYMVVTGARIEAATNSARSMSLQVRLDRDVAAGVQIDGLAHGVQAQGEVATVALPAASHADPARPVTYRITLAGDLQPGTYPWPVALALHGHP